MSDASRRLRATLVLLTVLGPAGCAPEPPARDAPAASERLGRSIPHPPLDGMEPEVARALEAQRQEVDALLGRAAVPASERARALGHLGKLYQAHRLIEGAEACYREAHALDPGSFEWAYYYGYLAARNGHLEEAAAALRRAVELRPRDLVAMIRLADLELERGEIDPAGALYERVRAVDPSVAAAEFGLGRVAAGRRSYREAIEHFDKALTLQPGASVIHYHLGQAYRQLRDLDRATSHLSLSGPVEVVMPDPLLSEVNMLAAGTSSYLTQGKMALRDGRLSIAVQVFRLAIEADPQDPEPRQRLASALVLVGDLQGAEEQLEAAARLAPADAQLQSELGTVLAELGRDGRALEHFRRAVEIDPELQQARFNLANALARLGQLGEAESHYRRLLEIDPGHLPARSRLGTVLAQSGRPEEAIAELRRVVQQDPEDTETRRNLARAHFNLALSHLRESDRQQALEHFRRALKHDDGLAPAHLYVANLLAGAGLLAEALPHFARVRELEPDHQTARLGEATALMYLGRYGEAKTVLEEAVRLLPDEAPSAHALARLLAGAPDPSLRDGRRSLALMSRVLQTATVPSWVETQAMALAEVGRFDDAVTRQRAVLAEVRRTGRATDAERLARNLARYESGLACCAEATDALP